MGAEELPPGLVKLSSLCSGIHGFGVGSTRGVRLASGVWSGGGVCVISGFGVRVIPSTLVAVGTLTVVLVWVGPGVALDLLVAVGPVVAVAEEVGELAAG